MPTKTRDSNIELLRILTICGVVVLHYNGNVAFNLVEVNSLNFYLLQGFEALFICAVNLFVLISGYFLSATNNRRAIKAVELVVQVVLIGIAFYLVSAALSRTFSLKSMLAAAIPNNYFVALYTTLYLISPYINLAIKKLSDKQLAIMTGLFFVLFSVWVTALDVFSTVMGQGYGGLYTTNSLGSQFGYSLINFALMYIIGAMLRRMEFGLKPYLYVVGFVASALVVFVWQLYQPLIARAYCNPAVILCAVFIFLIFKQFSFSSRIVNGLSKGSFTCFLVHGVLLNYIRIEKFVNSNPFMLVLHIIVSSVAIFAVSWVVWKIYDFVTKPVFGFVGTKLLWLNKILSPEENC